MTARSETVPVVVTGIGPICPEALSVADLVSAGPSPGRSPERSMSHFDPERFLGKRGFKFLSAATRYGLAAAHLALDDAGLSQTTIYAPEARGVFMGTNFAVHESVASMDALVLSQGAGALMAIETPNFSVNLPASYISLKCGFLAFNITLTNMLVAGVEAVMLGARNIQRGRAQLVLAGATEGSIPARDAALLGGTAADGGACMLALEALPAAQARGARVYAQVGGDALCFIPPDTARTASTWQPREALLRRRLDLLLGDHTALPLAMPTLECALTQRVNESVLRHLQDRGVTVHRHPTAGGAPDACVSPLLWLAALIAQHGEALLVVASPQGHVALMRLEPVSSPHTRAERAAAQAAGRVSVSS